MILIDGIAERLTGVEELLTHYAADESMNTALHTGIARLAMTGTSRLRLILHRSGFGQQYATEMGAVVALTGRLVDLAANFPYFTDQVSERDRERIGSVACRIREIRDALIRGSHPQVHKPAADSETGSQLPLLGEIEQAVSLIPQAFTGAGFLRLFASSPGPGVGTGRTFVSGKLLDPEHVKFAIRGSLAATSCYVIFNALFWLEISTAVTTCVLTALTTIGASRQKREFPVSVRDRG